MTGSTSGGPNGLHYPGRCAKGGSDDALSRVACRGRGARVAGGAACFVAAAVGGRATRARLCEGVALRVPGLALRVAARDRALPRFRRRRAHGRDRRQRGPGRTGRPGAEAPVRDALPDPPYVLLRHLRACRRTPARRRCHRVVRMSAGGRLSVQRLGEHRKRPLVGARLRRGDRPQPGREPLRRLRYDARQDGPVVPRPLTRPARHGDARRSCRSSSTPAGAGAAPGRGRPRTTCTSRSPGTDARQLSAFAPGACTSTGAARGGPSAGARRSRRARAAREARPTVPSYVPRAP